MNDELREKAPRQDQGLIGRAYELFDDFYAQTAELRMIWEENEELYTPITGGARARGTTNLSP